MFYDIGMVYWNFMDFSKTEVLDTYNGNRFMLLSGNKFYNDNVGVGIRLNLPIGPLRFDFGVPMTSESWNESSGKFQFGVGYTREF
jgi:outer membrane protein assembly factor BamA